MTWHDCIRLKTAYVRGQTINTRGAPPGRRTACEFVSLAKLARVMLRAGVGSVHRASVTAGGQSHRTRWAPNNFLI